MRHLPRVLTALILTMLLWLAPLRASAQELVISAGPDIMAGIEGGGSGYAAGVRRSRTTLRFAAEGFIDESPKNIFAAGVLVEIEPVASVGADLRYMRSFAEQFQFHVGATSIIAPKHMIGATFGFAWRYPLSESVHLNVNPTANVYFVGADLAGSTVLWQGMIAGGVRVRF